MLSVQDQWREIRATESKVLSDKQVSDANSVYVVAVESMGRPLPEGELRITAVQSLQAAKLIYAKTHRLATAKEINQYGEDEKLRAVAIRQRDMEKKQNIVIVDSQAAANLPKGVPVQKSA